MQLPGQLANEKNWEQLNNSNPKKDEAIIMMKHKFAQGNDSLSSQM